MVPKARAFRMPSFIPKVGQLVRVKKIHTEEQEGLLEEIGEVIKAEKDLTCEIRFPNKIAWFSFKDVEDVSEEHRAEFEDAVKAADYKPKVVEEDPYNPENAQNDINYLHYHH